MQVIMELRQPSVLDNRLKKIAEAKYPIYYRPHPDNGNKKDCHMTIDFKLRAQNAFIEKMKGYSEQVINDFEKEYGITTTI